jgi:hypothetical protein
MKKHDEVLYKNCHIKLNYKPWFREINFESEAEKKKHKEEVKRVKEMWDEMSDKEKDKHFAED